MNRFIKTGSAGLLITLLCTGCMSEATITNADQNLMEIGDTTYTRGFQFQLIKRASGPALVLQQTLNLIYDEEVGRDDEILEEASTLYDEYRDNYTASVTETTEEEPTEEQTADDETAQQETTQSADEEQTDEQEDEEDLFETYLLDYGYESKDEYIEEVLVPSVQSEKLFNKYFTDARDIIEVDYTPALVRIIELDSQDNAERALEAWKDGEEVETIVEQYGFEEAAYTGQEQLVVKDDASLPADLLNSIMDSTKTGIYDEVITYTVADETGTGEDSVSYYILDVVTRNYEELLDQLIEYFQDNSDMNTQATVYYLSKYDFEVHDQYLFDYWKANNPEYLVSRPDLMESDDE